MKTPEEAAVVAQGREKCGLAHFDQAGRKYRWNPGYL